MLHVVAVTMIRTVYIVAVLVNGVFIVSSTGTTGCCNNNERWVDCPDSLCIPMTCSELGFPIDCPPTSDQCRGEPGCICIEGYVRNCRGECIPKIECPSCGGDENAQSGCGINCGRLCSNYNKGPVDCGDICLLNSCDCKKEYVYDSNIKKCVLPEQCSPSNNCDINNNNSGNGTDSNNDANTSKDQHSLNLFIQGNTAFTGDLLYEVVQSKPGESIILSAFSVMTPLAELALYDTGDSLDELLKVFNLQNKDQIRIVMTILREKLESVKNVTLDLGAKVYVNENYELSDNFKEDTENVFNAPAEEINVNNPTIASETINKWVEQVTHGKIQNLVSPDMITILTRLILANAIYFKGTWKVQFDSKNTEDRDFHVNSNLTIQVPTMVVKDKYKYFQSSDLDAKFIELPYVDERIRFICGLPNTVDGLDSLLDKVRDPAVFNTAIQSMSIQTVTISLPKMDIETTTNLVDILPEVQVTKIFSTSDSGLSGILKNNNENLYVSDAIQKASITVDEVGSEAAAANAFVGTAAGSISEPTEYFFTADHPTLYYIMLDDIILFSGVFVHPDSVMN